MGIFPPTGRTDSISSMAMRLILTVEEVFDIAGRGLVLTPKIPENLGFAIRPKDPVQLRTPQGRTLETYIACFSSGRPRGGGHRFYCIVLPPDLPKSDVPIGTEVWYLSSGGEDRG
jgi:hypothetical protein